MPVPDGVIAQLNMLSATDQQDILKSVNSIEVGCVTVEHFLRLREADTRTRYRRLTGTGASSRYAGAHSVLI